MCKKLIVLLVVVALTMPASAVYIGMNGDDEPDGCANPLKIDIDGESVTPKCTTTPPWQSWLFARGWTGPISKAFNNPLADYDFEKPMVQAEVYRKPLPDGVGASRNRSGGLIFVGNTGDYSAGTQGYGMNYMKLTFTQMKPLTQYKFYLWGMENRPVWSMRTDNPDSKFVAWSTTNPKAWLDTHAGQYNGIGDGTHDPNGYGPKFSVDNPIATTDTNMPGSATNPYTGPGSSLYDLVMGCGAEGDRASLIAEDGDDHVGDLTSANMASFYASTNDLGQVVIYGWMDATDWGGSAHVPLCGILVVPEPATIALLGLGGLALIRRKRA